MSELENLKAELVDVQGDLVALKNEIKATHRPSEDYTLLIKNYGLLLEEKNRLVGKIDALEGSSWMCLDFYRILWWIDTQMLWNDD